ncbi:MAG TPA: iron donor protein CyaY [Candidatus Aquabacterium excrementipullorum]|nr:iron donor protein CyaY [Candidatus Aquabacterium excrementipullorum]
MSDTTTPSGWPDALYDQAAHRALARIESCIDQWLEDDVVDIDSARSGGMITLTLPNRTQLIINMQPPLHELWLAARSGGYHFRFGGESTGEGVWQDTRTGEDFFLVLSRCASEQAGKALQF